MMIVCELCIFRFGVRRFERRINDLLAAGWELKECWAGLSVLRVFCFAKLEKCS